jgi:hypothetical protein
MLFAVFDASTMRQHDIVWAPISSIKAIASNGFNPGC